MYSYNLLSVLLLLQPQAAPSACVVYVVGRARLPAFVCRASARTLPAGPPRSEPALVPPHSVQRVFVPRLVKVLPGAGVRRVENRPVRPRACQQGRSAGREVRHEALVRRKRQLKGWAHLLPRRIRAHRHALSALFSPFVYSRKPAGNTEYWLRGARPSEDSSGRRAAGRGRVRRGAHCVGLTFTCLPSCLASSLPAYS